MDNLQDNHVYFHDQLTKDSRRQINIDFLTTWTIDSFIKMSKNLRLIFLRLTVNTLVVWTLYLVSLQKGKGMGKVFTMNASSMLRILEYNVVLAVGSEFVKKYYTPGNKTLDVIPFGFFLVYAGITFSSLGGRVGDCQGFDWTKTHAESPEFAKPCWVKGCDRNCEPLVRSTARIFLFLAFQCVGMNYANVKTAVIKIR